MWSGGYLFSFVLSAFIAGSWCAYPFALAFPMSDVDRF